MGYDGWYIIEAHYPKNRTPMETVRLNRAEVRGPGGSVLLACGRDTRVQVTATGGHERACALIPRISSRRRVAMKIYI